MQWQEEPTSEKLRQDPCRLTQTETTTTRHFLRQSIFDLSVGYDLTKNLRLSIGGSNVFNKYPDILRPENQGFYLYDNNQQGSNGAYYYGRVSFNFLIFSGHENIS